MVELKNLEIPKKEVRLISFIREGVDLVIVTRHDESKFARIEDTHRKQAMFFEFEQLRAIIKELDQTH